MPKEIKRSYNFALITASYVTALLLVVLGCYQFFLLGGISFLPLFIFALFSFGFCFLIVQLRIEHFIYKRVREVYDNISLLDSTSLQKNPITTDMAALTREVEKFAEDKKLEIELLKARENYRKDFLGNISHELRTPLFTVQGYILTLLDGAVKDKKIRKKYLTQAGKGVDRLIYIVQDLEMIAKLETGNLTLHKENFNIVEIVRNVFYLMEMKAAKKDISLSFDRDYDEQINVHADQERIQQVITNLVVNSIKYGKKGGTTEVSIEELTTKKLIVRITDNGEGIQKKHIPRLFERFYRVDKSGSRKEGGSGLGLSIVKHILEAHGEKLYVESDFGVGSEFSFTVEKAEPLQGSEP